MRVLVACEESQTITNEFRRRGFEAYSCDVQECSGGHPEWHIINDAIFEAYSGKYDMMIAHPPCTFLTVTANRWNHPKYRDRFPNRANQRIEAIAFFKVLYDAPIDKLAIENPVGVMSSEFRKPNQYVQPYWFGDPYRKKTGLWLKGLPELQPTEMVEPKIIQLASGARFDAWQYESFNLKLKDRAKFRSKTPLGMAKAIVDQWT